MSYPYEETGLPHVDGAPESSEALSGEVVDLVELGPYTAAVTMHRRRGAWMACATIETNAGPLRWCGVARDREVAERLVNERRQQAVSGLNFNALLRDMGTAIDRGARELARNRALRRTVGDIRRTLARPELQPVLAVAQQIPYLGPALTAFRAATTVVDDVLGGNTQTRQQLVQLRRAAQGGNPRAREALSVVDTVLRSQRRVTRQRAGTAQGSSAAAGHDPGRRGRRGRVRRRSSRSRHPSPRSRRTTRSPSQARSPSLRERRAWQRAEQEWARRSRVDARPVIVPPAPRS